jgi:GntR family transcriptional regulator
VPNVMTLSKSGRKPPLYQAIESELLDRIARGDYPAGSMLPTESDLCSEFGASRITIRRAVEGLVNRRLVQRTPGRGTVVCDPAEMVKAVTLTGYIDDAIPLNRHRVIDDTMRVPPDAVASLLRIPNGQAARCIRSVNHAGELPLSYAHFYFPPATAGLIRAADFLGSTPPIRIIESRSGTPVTSAHQLVEPVTADAEVATHLGIEVGRPVLRAIRTYVSADRQPLEIVFVHYHPERYRYEVTLLPKVVPVHRGGTGA